VGRLGAFAAVGRLRHPPSRDTARVMSQENVEIARRLYPGAVDVVTVLADRKALNATLGPLVQPDFETVTVPGQVPLSGAGAEDPSRPIFYGLDGFVNAFHDWLTAWETWVVTPTDFIDVDENRVLVMLDIRARSKTHKVEMPVEGANLLTIKDGTIARIELFFERDQALEAAGLTE
jgi:SnoaL-like protein